MNRPGQLWLRLVPTREVLPPDVVERALEALAALLLQVEATEDTALVHGDSAREVANEHRS